MFPNRKRKRRARQLPGPPLPRLVSTHHPGHDRPNIPRRHRSPAPEEKGGSVPDRDGPEPHPDPNDTTGDTRTEPPPRRPPRISLTLAEIRRLFNVRDQTKRIIHAAMAWSIYRREHQAQARGHHFSRRLKIQYL